MTTENTNVEQPAVPERGTPEYNEHMANLYDSQNSQPTNTPAEPGAATKPDWLPEQFWNAETGQADYEGLAKSYAEKSAEPPKEPEAPKEGEKTDTGPELNFDEIGARLTETGTITEEDFGKLEAAGIPREIVEQYVENVAAIKEMARERTEAYVGGKDKLEAMLGWAGQNLAETEVNTINGMLNSPNWKMGMDLLQLRFGASNPGSKEPQNPLTGANLSSGADAAFRSRQEMSAAINDPRYRNDPAYRDSVRRRVAITQF